MGEGRHWGARRVIQGGKSVRPAPLPAPPPARAHPVFSGHQARGEGQEFLLDCIMRYVSNAAATKKNQVRYVQDLEGVSVVYERSRVSLRRGDGNTARYHDNHEEGIKKKMDVATKEGRK
jgi:hypothetical protein